MCRSDMSFPGLQSQLTLLETSLVPTQEGSGNQTTGTLASFPGFQSPNAVEGLVKLLRRMTSGRRWYIYIRGGSAGIRNLYSYVTSSGDIRYDNVKIIIQKQQCIHSVVTKRGG